ncbi:hypothetical protein BDY19DRAFT_993340 [Irpex rosettiformis]|uniref:Uncharacterized protein n=1 Tax=Irpex rosettiformis TaxID=378272 RepID=A0ACB8U4E6_9APHY|nr:hypothetical protein BDY19DRAFT_993340 [Irpex rosettiformis]
MWYTVFTFLLLACSAPGALSQFQFFEQMFGQGQHPGHQQRQPNHAPQWAAQADAVPCSNYLCPETLACVPNPSQCPCPNAEDVKCLIPDTEEKGSATVVCVRGANDCIAVEQLSLKFGK